MYELLHIVVRDFNEIYTVLNTSIYTDEIKIAFTFINPFLKSYIYIFNVFVITLI